MSTVTTADISKLRKLTGAGLMDCKKALEESGNDIEKAIDVIRKRGKAIASKRSDRDATEGAVLAKTSADQKFVAMISLNCETDFVAKNETFLGLANSILNIALDKKPATLEELKSLPLNGKAISDVIDESVAAIGEKVDLSYYETLKSEYTIAYIHAGNKLSTMVSFNKAIADIQVAKDVAMQVAAMNPVAVDKDDVSPETIAREIEIGKDQARQEGKAEEMVEKIALGKLGKFYKENTLINQAFIKDQKISVNDYLKSVDKDLSVIEFRRFSLTN